MIIDVTEELCRADGSGGWTILIGNGTAFFAWLDPEVAETLIRDDANFVSTSMFASWGVPSPTGRVR
jgi:hypothetical protein